MVKRLNYIVTSKISLLLLLILAFGCSEDTAPVEPEKTTGTLKTVILSATNSSAISNANVVLYNADNNEAVLRKSTDTNGECSFECDPGNYFIRVSAQGYQSSPPENNTPIPFAIDKGESLNREYHLNPMDVPQPGQISGYVDPNINTLSG